MTNYQGVRRLKKYLGNKYGISTFGTYERYSGYENLFYATLDDDDTHAMVIRAYTDSVWLAFYKYDYDRCCWRQVCRCETLSLEEFHEIIDGGKADLAAN